MEPSALIMRMCLLEELDSIFEPTFSSYLVAVTISAAFLSEDTWLVLIGVLRTEYNHTVKEQVDLDSHIVVPGEILTQ
ncbi:uncharacterized protein PADG_12006 [Paracoccidioides brasiliensis Pb18]|uniref:Uncharacterized protein n=1 Tax=Paracoccidioides brasiliensis (strain Pb18) TaxID=502780 RepID=A0A0A0HT86_PARBD|nr:uncharacterized protein PADG_12006 [Paracoccidioides brasiliensis Pb18]KGM91867.1 hypothetical protein PADG_12006 [Paracoccidioides brasiliensis Pb18]